MKRFLIKHFGLDYDSKVFGRHSRIPRSTIWIVPLFLIAALFTMTREPEEMGALWLIWIPFTLTIFLGFPIPKSKWVNYPAIAMFLIVWYFENLWTAIPLLFFIVGIFLDRSKFLFFTIKYSDLEDWEQQYQYLNRPRVISIANVDNSEPTGFALEKELKRLKELHDNKYGGDERFVEPMRFFWPFLCAILAIVYLVIFGAEPNGFNELRGF